MRWAVAFVIALFIVDVLMIVLYVRLKLTERRRRLRSVNKT